MANDLRLDILGASFTITADEDEEYLHKVLLQYQKAVSNTQNISGITNSLNVAVLTGFMLCDEVNKLKQQIDDELASLAQFAAKSHAENQAENDEVQDRITRLISKLDQTFRIFGNEKYL